MADQKYSNSYQHRWVVPTVHVAAPGQSPSFDNRASSGERTAAGSANNAAPYQQAEGSLLSGRMQPPHSTSSTTASNGIVTRSKNHAHGKDPPVPSKVSHHQPGRVSPHDKKDHKPEQNMHGKAVRHHGRVHQGAVCTIPGKCQAGGELGLAHLAPVSSSVEYPPSFSLVGLKSPLLPGMTLVAAVDRRYLPDEETCVTMLGFSGYCVGCGAKGFRYFTEFSQHINLRLATQPKKQKHIKYYIIKDQTGRLRKGAAIPWKVEGRKRSMPLSGPYMMTTEEEVPNVASSSSPASGPPQLTQSFSQIPATTSSESSTFSVVPSQLSGPGYSHLPPKRSRWESGSESEAVNVYSGDEESSPAHSPAQDTNRIELPNKPWLTAACGVCPVLLLCQHSIPNVPCSVDDIIVSDLLVGCFDPPLVSDRNQFGNYSGAYNTQVPSPSMSPGDPYINCKSPLPGQSRYYTSSPLTTQMAIILMIQHLSQLNEDDRLSREDIESLLQDAQLELSAGYQQPHVVAQSNLLTHVQLPILANLAAATSKGGVKIITSPVSLENAILRALKFIVEIIRHNQQKFPKVPVPDFIFILSTSQQKAPEFCVLVTGIHQARYLSEAMIGHPVGGRITDNLGKLEQLFRLSSDALEQLVNSYEEVMGHGQLVYIPFNGYARMKIHAEEAVRLEPKITVTSFQHYGKPSSTVYATQNLMAKQLVAQVCSMGENSSILDISEFVKVDFTIVVPPIVTLFNQTVQRVASAGVLEDLELEKADSASAFETAMNYVIKHDDCEETQEKLTKFLKKVHTQPKTLFVMVFDQSQFYSSPRGVLDLPYYKEFLDAFNVIPLFVTSAPYLFQSNRSFIEPVNEVYWSDSKTDSDSGSVASMCGDDDQYMDDQDAMYFGLKEYCDSIKWTHQFPLFRQDDAFERMALRTTRATDDVNVSVLRCYLLIRHYCAAIMWAAGIKPAEPHCTLKTIQIIREIIESPVRNADGSGTMLVIRIPSVELAVLAFDSLKNVRDRLGFQYRFCVIHDNGTGELEIEEYFLQRLRLWKSQRGLLDGKSVDEWQPRCYEELLDLPCILLLSGRERTGETFPRSLKYIDIRLIDRGFLYRSSLELEFSAIACYISTGAGPRTSSGIAAAESVDSSGNGDDKDADSSGTTQSKTSHYSSNYPLPVVLVSRSAFKAFQTDFYGYPKHLLLPTTPQTRWIGLGRPHLVTSNPAHQSLYYRQWTEPKPKHLVGRQCSSMTSRQVIGMRSGSGIVISPDIPDVVEEDGMSAVETMTDTRQASAAGSEAEDNSGEEKPDSPSQKRDKDESVSKTRMSHDIRPGPTMVNMGTSSVASETDTEPGVGAITDEESDTEGGGTKYHPRSILFSGAPQVGKTGAYLHFMRLLHRMLIKLQRVDVYDEAPWIPEPEKSAKKPPKDTSNPIYPDRHTLTALPFKCDLKQHCYEGISPLKHLAKGYNPAPEGAPTSRPVTSIMLSPWSSHDVCHHCESCKQYRDGMGPGSAQCYVYTLQSGDVLSFIIPPTHLASFIFNEEKQVQSLRLSQMKTESATNGAAEIKLENKQERKVVVKTPILTPSTGRHETGLLNLFHALEGESHIHMVFVKHHEMAAYHKVWPNHVIVGLPQDSDKEGAGSARYFIKEFATENFYKERKRQGVDGTHGHDLWPLVMMMDDSCVMWQNLLQSKPAKTDADDKMEEDTATIGNNTSLLKVLQYVEAMPNIAAVGAVGFQQFSTKAPSTPMTKPSWSHCPVGVAVLINIPGTAAVQYDRLKYAYEDIDWSLKLHAFDKVTCCFNHITVAKKRIENGGRPAFKMILKSCSDESGEPKVVPFKSTEFSKFVTAPDTEDTHFFSAPAQYLLELYLAQAAATKLFQSAADKPDCPVLVLNCYVNLGPRLAVEYLSTRKLEQERKLRGKSSEKQGTKYGGLLLYFSDETVTRALLQHFQFTEDAQLCLVCQDRNTLRQEVVRLDLEEHWRFRLRDELQTANHPDEQSLFLLTGKHD